MSHGELVDIVDDQDRVVGTSDRATMRTHNLWHRTVAVLCFNQLGQLYVQRRSAHKDLHPGHYDMFAAGCVAAGEAYDAAAERELAEELGVTGGVLVRLLKHAEGGPQTRTQTWIYRTTWSGPMRHVDGEVDWGTFLDVQHVIENPAGWRYTPDGLAHFEALLRRGLVPRKPSR